MVRWVSTASMNSWSRGSPCQIDVMPGSPSPVRAQKPLSWAKPRTISRSEGGACGGGR
jgi:hypothetical protein